MQQPGAGDARNIASIGDFFRQTGASYRVYDLGRRIEACGKRQFELFEALHSPWPWPIQRHACFGVVFWYPQREDARMVWFLRLPLDEQGLLIPAARDSFLESLLARVGQNIEALRSGEQLEDTPEDSPVAFKPREDRLASFHARVTAALELPASRHYPHALDYLRGDSGWEQWAFVGMQGLADVAARHRQHAGLIAAALADLPVEPLEALCGALDSEASGVEIGAALQARLDRELAGGDAASPRVAAACLRGIAGGPQRPAQNRAGQSGAAQKSVAAIRRQMLASALAHPVGCDLEVLASVTGRLWEELRDAELLAAFLAAAAHNRDGQGAFNQLLIDLLYLPGMREPVLEGFRQPQRPEALSIAIGGFFSALRG